jgi:hypothetical protein
VENVHPHPLPHNTDLKENSLVNLLLKGIIKIN